MDLTKTIDSRELKLSFEADKITRNNLNNTVLVIPGQIEYFAMRTPPKGWFECNGDTFDPNIYIDLSNAIGNRWGTHGTNYKLPDYRGVFLRSWANDSSIYDIGRNINTYQDSDVKEHNHPYSINSHSHTFTQSADNHNHLVYHTRNWRHGGHANGIAPGAYRGWKADVGHFDWGGNHRHGNFQSSSPNEIITTDPNNNHETRPINFSILVCIKY